MNLVAIILAGGFGTRLQSVVNDVPKPMAPVAGRPFLEWVLDYCLENGIQEAILSVGYKSDIIIQHFGNEYKGIQIKYAKEKEPLGTGGAIRYAMEMLEDDKNCLILNGDTLFKSDINMLFNAFQEEEADLIVSLRRMFDFDRYGVVELDKNNRIISFQEKKHCDEGLINGGVYIVNSKLIKNLFPKIETFSFEKDFMERYVEQLKFVGIEQSGYFIDIGIPEDFEKANNDLK
jgi:D-glycero-alpha-D-manno-heptose 1-phosphate guanylyltransferase